MRGVCFNSLIIWEISLPMMFDFTTRFGSLQFSWQLPEPLGFTGRGAKPDQGNPQPQKKIHSVMRIPLSSA
jgi:hypothetical protein